MPTAYIFTCIQSIYLVLNWSLFVCLFFLHHWIRFMLWPYTLHKLFSWMYVQGFDYIVCCHQICFQLSKVKPYTATLTVSCRSTINNSCLSIPGLSFSLHIGWSCWFFSQCVSHYLCLCFSSLEELCQNPLYDFVSPSMRLQLHLLSSHQKEYFIVIQCVWVPVSLQK